MQVVDIAQPPEWKSKPRKALIVVLTTLSTFVILALFILIRHTIREAAKDAQFAEKLNRLSQYLRLRGV